MTNPAQEILIIGLGLIGSSLAKAAKNKGLVVHGYDLDQISLTPVSYTHLTLPTILRV